MFDIINHAMLYLLDMLDKVTGSYGLAIVALTVLIRLALWPVNSAQTRSMKKMQELQPKLKQLQERFKDNPQKMQEAMMKFYSENKFNPLAGCLPILIQIPIFIGLYGALNSPAFMIQAGNEGFLFIDKLYNTLQTHAGQPLDGTFHVMQNDKFQTDQTAHIVFKDPNKQPLSIHVKDANKILTVKPQPLIPGDPMTFEIPFKRLGLSSDYADTAQYVELTVVNQNSREVEPLRFEPQNKTLVSQVPTEVGQPSVHQDVLLLIILYGVLTVLYQQLMAKGAPPPANEAAAAQQRMMKFLPIMFVGVLFFIPIPAGVMLYLVVTTFLMYLQTAIIQWQDSRNPEPPTKAADRVIDIKPDGA